MAKHSEQPRVFKRKRFSTDQILLLLTLLTNFTILAVISYPYYCEYLVKYNIIKK